jgi:nucleoid-associated protein YgaU
MKRDARIGLAVVLVLGLAVTLLVGRALYKRGTPAPSDAEEVATAGDAPTTTDIHGGDATTSSTPATAANSTPNPNTSLPNHGDTAVQHAPDAPGLRPFIEDERKPITSVNDHAATIVPAPITDAHGAKPPVPATAGDHSSPPPANNSGASSAGWEDHEGTPSDPHTAEAPSGGYGYTVQSGDNMWKISSKVYGDGKYTQKIAEANPGMNSQKLKVGSVIKIPSIPNKTVLLKLPSFGEAGSAVAQHRAAPAESAPAAASMPVAAADSHEAFAGATHKVEAGETLGSIAKKYYGSAGPKSVALIVAANKGLEPTKLKVGQELVIPAKK